MHARLSNSPLATIACLTLFVVGHDVASRSAEPAKPTPSVVAKPAAALHQQTVDPLQAALERRVKLDFDGTPLDKALAAIARENGIKISLDTQEMETHQIETDTPITLHVADCRLRSALRVLLRPLDLAFDADEQRVLVEPSDHYHHKVKIYEVSDLVIAHDSSGQITGYDHDSLIELITTCVQPTTWDEVGGSGAIHEFSGTLVVDQNEEAQEQIATLLAALRKAKQQMAFEPLWVGDAESTAAIERALARRVSLKFDETPLSELVKQLRAKHGLGVQLATWSMQQTETAPESPITIDMKDVPLSVALARVLKDLGLDSFIADEQLWIAPSSSSTMTMRIYPVNDLIAIEEATQSYSRYPTSGYDSVIELITTTVWPTTWDEVGGWGSIHEYRPVGIVCGQSIGAHQQIEKLLADLRATLQRQKTSGTPLVIDPKELVTRFYPLTTSRPRPAPTKVVVTTAQELAPPSEQQPLAHAEGNEIVQLALSTIEPKGWSREGAFIKVVAGNLVVRHTRDTQRQVRALLDHLGVDIHSGTKAGGFGPKNGSRTPGGAIGGQ